MIEKEIEIKVLGYSLDELKNMIEDLGAKFQGVEEQSNYRFETPNVNEDSYLRLRVTDNNSEFTFKKRLGSVGARTNSELTTRIDDPEVFLQIMDEIGMSYSLQKKTRYKYLLDKFVFDIDLWDKAVYPYPYLEIEGPSQEDLDKILARLNIPKENITTKSIGELINDL